MRVNTRPLSMSLSIITTLCRLCNTMGSASPWLSVLPNYISTTVLTYWTSNGSTDSIANCTISQALFANWYADCTVIVTVSTIPIARQSLAYFLWCLLLHRRTGAGAISSGCKAFSSWDGREEWEGLLTDLPSTLGASKESSSLSKELSQWDSIRIIST